jgi:hypothetical protein
MKKLLFLMLLLVSQTVLSEEPIRVHCVGEGTKTFKNVGSEDMSVDKYYEFYKDKMTETVNASTLNFSKEDITKQSDKHYGIYSIEPTKIFVLNNSINEHYKQISIDRQTGKWDYMLDSNILIPNTILIHGFCEPWKPEKKF